MVGRSGDLGGVPAVASDGTSSPDNVLPEEQPALDGDSRQAQDADGSLEAGMRADFSKSVGSGLKKDLQKCATFPSCTAEAGQDSCGADDALKDAHTYQRSVSLPLDFSDSRSGHWSALLAQTCVGLDRLLAEGLCWITRCLQERSLFQEASCLMVGRSGDLGGVPAVASDGTSSPDNSVLPEEQSALDGGSRQAQNADGSLEAGTRADFSKSVGSGVKKDLQKCATFPSCTIEAGQEDSCCGSDDAPRDAHTYQRSVSLPPPVKLISAMKGSRQKNGVPSPTENRHIKWAEDVYDPPVTSVSHSVNNSYKRRPNPRKKDKSKQKQKQKGRSKKKTKNTNQNPAAIQSTGLEDFDTSIGREDLADPGKHEAEILDYGISSQDATCGSSFLLEMVAKMHFSTAEAS